MAQDHQRDRRYVNEIRLLWVASSLAALLLTGSGCAKPGSAEIEALMGPVPERLPRKAETREVRCSVTPATVWREGWEAKPDVLWVEPQTKMAWIIRQSRVEDGVLVVQVPPRPGRVGLMVDEIGDEGRSQGVFGEVNEAGHCGGIRGRERS